MFDEAHGSVFLSEHSAHKNQSQDDPYLPSSTACNRLWSGGHCAEFRRTFSAMTIYHVGGRNFDKDVGGVESGHRNPDAQLIHLHCLICATHALPLLQ